VLPQTPWLDLRSHTSKRRKGKKKVGKSESKGGDGKEKKGGREKEKGGGEPSGFVVPEKNS